MNDIITLSHGSGGKKTHKLIDELFHKYMKNDILLVKGDSAILECTSNFKVAFTTDSYVITPVFFNGGDIGKISVCGTVNDLAVSGATPLYLSCGFIIEEGLLIDELEQIVKSMAETCVLANVKIVTGDTKVVPHGAADKIFINTSGIGILKHPFDLGSHRIKESDCVIVSGTMGDHEASILVSRENLLIDADIKSDCAPLNHMISKILDKFGENIHLMRDPTRGGLASTLNEFVEKSKLSIKLDEASIPLNEKVSGICEMLGLDPLYMANEGKVIIVCSPHVAQDVVKLLKSDVNGTNASIIGEVVNDEKGKVFIKTLTGGTRIVDMLVGEQLPRIC